MAALAEFCNLPIKGRDGKPIGFACNLEPSHLGDCAQVLPELLARPAEHPAEGGAE